MCIRDRPKPVFVEVAKDLVMNQALSYFAREWFIEELALLQFSEPLTFLWYDNQPQTVLQMCIRDSFKRNELVYLC